MMASEVLLRFTMHLFNATYASAKSPSLYKGRGEGENLATAFPPLNSSHKTARPPKPRRRREGTEIPTLSREPLQRRRST